MPKFQFAKLVRDKIIENQLQSGATPVYRQLSPDEHKQELVRKIAEEAAEIIHVPADEVAMEIADVQQAIDDLCTLYGVSTDDVKAAQQRKNEKNGAFKQGFYVEYVELDENDPWADYYRKNADRYPELTA